MANNLDNFTPEIWSTALIERIDQVNLAMMLCANTDYEGEIRRAGDTVQVRTPGDVTMRPYGRGGSVTYEDLTPTKETMVIDQSHYFAFAVDDLDVAQNDIDAARVYTARAGVSVANHLDDYVFSFYSQALTANQVSNGGSAIDITASSAGTTHVVDLLLEAQENLDDQSVPADGRWIVVSPYYKKLLMKDTVYFINGSTLGDHILTTARFMGASMTARDALGRGFVGQACGFDVYTSTNLPTSGSGRYCPYGQGRPISFAAQIQPGTMEALRLESTFGTAVRGLLLYGGEVFNEHAKRLGYIFVDNS